MVLFGSKASGPLSHLICIAWQCVELFEGQKGVCSTPLKCPLLTSPNIHGVSGSVTQGRSQVIADARAQHGHTTLVRNSAQSAEAFRRSGTCSVSVRGERMRLEFCVIYKAILCRSISRRFSGRFVIDYDTISADNLYAYPVHRWGTASGC